MSVTINGTPYAIQPEERLIDLIERNGVDVPQVCYHPQLGPIQTCDTCMVEVDGKLVRACATSAADGMQVVTAVGASDWRAARGLRPDPRQSSCCTARSATTTTAIARCTTRPRCSRWSTRRFRTSRSRMTWICRIPSIATIRINAFCAGDAWRPARTLQVNETLSIDWEDAHPRVLWDGGAPIGESSCVSCGHCVTVCPCNALMEKSMLGEAGYFTALPKARARRHDRRSEGDRAGGGVWRDSAAVRSGSDHARVAHQADEDSVHVLRRRLQLRYLDARTGTF